MIYDSVHSANYMEAVNEAIKKYQSKEEHIFLILHNKKMKYIDLSVYDYAIPLDDGIFQFQLSEQGEIASNYMRKARKIFVYPRTPSISHLINKETLSAEIYWFVWGYELYGNIPRKIYDEFTKPYTKNDGFAFSRHTQVAMQQTILRIDYVLAFFEEEYSLIKTYLNKNIKTAPFPYFLSKEVYNVAKTKSRLKASKYSR